ncbi:hypothetical protein [Acinetobacter johnsonii]|uniref:hypothetical protein n=1 Tax=Acinetobacter johnsonii TaxID=40214 RepID=UPI00300B3A53
MATDVEVQYFSHLNGLVLGNNWGDLIRLLDKALVTGIDFTQITAASIDAQGDIHITLFAAHNAMLFQVVELSGFTPNALDQKYRIKGVPSTTQLILKPKDSITGTTISVVGNGKLAPLGYDIIFRDVNDVKRVYRAKNPTAQHPFIRVDESLTSPDGATGIYKSTYAKYAMVGLLEHMEHIDDYEIPDVLQLPFDPSNPAKNWKIAGSDSSVVRGWSRWYWARGGSDIFNTSADSSAPATASRSFTIAGDKDAFYFLSAPGTKVNYKTLKGCGLFTSALPDGVVKNWFLMSTIKSDTAATSYEEYRAFGATPLTNLGQASYTSYTFHVPTFNEASPLSAHIPTSPILPDSGTGYSALFSGTAISALEVPFSDTQKKLRGTLKHVMYSGIYLSNLVETTPVISGSSMYINDSLATIMSGNVYTGGLTFYLGEIE